MRAGSVGWAIAREGLVNAVVLTKQRYTLEDWLTLPDDGRRYELLDGELVEMPPPTVNHQIIVGMLHVWLYRAQIAGYGRVLMGPVAVLLDPTLRRQNAPEPDVFFIRQEREHIVRAAAIEGAPDLVIEILSPDTRAKDIVGGVKWGLYQRYAVPHYWVVDLRLQTVTQYTFEDTTFSAPVVRGLGDTLEFPIFPGLTLSVADLFRDLRAE
jgi:Uma2 family endonuclease